MTALNLKLQMIRRELGDHELSAKLSAIEDTVQKAITRLRNLIFELNPPALRRHGLAAALTQYLEQFKEDTGQQFELENKLQIEPPLDERIVGYRIAQEALTNIRKHARASRVGVLLSTRDDDGLLVRISDDGVGFDLEQVEDPAPGHLGLPNMRQRAQLAGGWCSVESTPGSGTVVEYWIPIRPDAGE